jgi:hypothetical protein
MLLENIQNEVFWIGLFIAVPNTLSKLKITSPSSKLKISVGIYSLMKLM